MELPKNSLDEMLAKIEQGDFAALRADAKEFLKFASGISVERPASLRYGDTTLKFSASLKGSDVRRQRLAQEADEPREAEQPRQAAERQTLEAQETRKREDGHRDRAADEGQIQGKKPRGRIVPLAPEINQAAARLAQENELRRRQQRDRGHDGPTIGM